jgi:ABC-type transport system involved in multi-copper enzyme maturation permease subunit
VSGVSDTGLTGGQATLALARLAVVRAIRGKALWIACALSLLPLVVLGVQLSLGISRENMWRTAFELTLLTLPIIPSILVGPSLSDELEDKTSAYLWSRALPRWSIIAGKLVGLAPLAAVIPAASITISWLVMGGPGVIAPEQFARGIVGSCSATIVAAALVAALSTLAPRHAVAVSVVYLLFIDKVVGELPIKLKYISISSGGRAIAGFSDTDVTAAVGAVSLVAIAAIAITIAVTRIARLE